MRSARRTSIRSPRWPGGRSATSTCAGRLRWRPARSRPTTCGGAWSGDVDGAFSWLGRAFAEKDAGLNYVRHDPLLAKLRGDPGWTALLNKMKLPVE
jgi:hypothetical protein